MLHGSRCGFLYALHITFSDEAENILAKWEADNPLITNAQQVNKMFKETFGITYHEAVKRPAWWAREYVPKKGATSE